MTAAASAAAVLCVGLVTYASRAGLIVFLAIGDSRRTSAARLRYVGPAVLSALTVNLLAGGQGASGVETAELGAVGACIVVVLVTRNLVASLAAGMVTLWILVWLL